MTGSTNHGDKGASTEAPTAALVHGIAVDLAPGDRVHRLGAPGARFKRYLVDDTVVDLYCKPKARTNVHLQLERKGTLVLSANYPVTYHRPTPAERAAEAAERAAAADQWQAAKDRGYARRAARQGGKR